MGRETSAGPWGGWKEWREVISEINDTQRVARLGMRFYHEFFGDAGGEEDVKPYVEAFADLLQQAFSKMDNATLREVRENLIWRGRFFESGLWESPVCTAEAHQLIEDSVRAGRSPTLLELLLIAHDLEFFIRPNLLRLLWVARRTDPSCEIPYIAAQLKKGGQQGTLGYAVRELLEWVTSPSSNVLGDSQREAVAELARSFKADEPNHIGLNDYRNWIDHRDFLIKSDEVILNFHPAPGRRLKVPRVEVTIMRRQLLGLMSLTKAFQIMFHAHDVARYPSGE